MENSVICLCEDCQDVRTGRNNIILQLNMLLPPGSGCPFTRGAMTLHSKLLIREQSLDHRLVTRSLNKLVEVMQYCRDTSTAWAVWAMVNVFRVKDSPIAGEHVMGIDYKYNEHNEIEWAIAPMNNELSRARREDIRSLQRLGLSGYTEVIGDLPMTRLDSHYWDWESRPM